MAALPAGEEPEDVALEPAALLLLETNTLAVAASRVLATGG
jgi:hypothetical protein